MTNRTLSRVFVLEKTPISDLDDGPTPPVAGDLIIYLRELQDLYGRHGESLKRRGVTTIWGPSLLSRTDFLEIDKFVDDYQNKWFVVDGKDISADGQLSLGIFAGGRIAMAQKPTLIVMLGEICRLAFRGITGQAILVSDICDGETQFNDYFHHPDINPRQKLMQKLARAQGWEYQFIAPKKQLPNINRTSRNPGRLKPYLDILRRFAGGLRPGFLAARLFAHKRRSTEKRVYFYLNHGIKHVATALSHRPNTRVFCDQIGVPGTTVLRYDHHFPAIESELTKAVGRMQIRLSDLECQPDLFSLKGLDYGPILLAGLRAYLEGEFRLDLFRMKQGLRLIKSYHMDMVVVCGDIAHMFVAMARAQKYGYESIFIHHGINLSKSGLRDSHGNHQDTVYIVPGSDHMDDYGAKLADDQKPERHVLGSPAMLEVEHIQGGPMKSGTPRILFANFPAKYANSCRSVYDADVYMRDILAVSKKLIDRGYRISFRPHPGDDLAYIGEMLLEFGISDSVKIDTLPSFAESLKDHDVFVANTTTCIYQALYAGWPTIFYDPKPDSDFLIGLPVAADIPYALAKTPGELEQRILDAEDKSSDIAKLPELFRTKLAPRFIGDTGQGSLDRIVDLLDAKLSREPVWQKPPHKTTASAA